MRLVDYGDTIDDASDATSVVYISCSITIGGAFVKTSSSGNVAYKETEPCIYLPIFSLVTLVIVITMPFFVHFNFHVSSFICFFHNCMQPQNQTGKKTIHM